MWSGEVLPNTSKASAIHNALDRGAIGGGKGRFARERWPRSRGYAANCSRDPASRVWSSHLSKTSESHTERSNVVRVLGKSRLSLPSPFLGTTRSGDRCKGRHPSNDQLLIRGNLVTPVRREDSDSLQGFDLPGADPPADEESEYYGSPGPRCHARGGKLVTWTIFGRVLQGKQQATLV